MFSTILKGNNEFFGDFLDITDFWLDGIKESIVNNVFVFGSVELMKMKTLVCSLTDLRKKKLGINQSLNRKRVDDIIEKTVFLWKFITQTFLNSLESGKTVIEVAKLNKAVDKCLLFLILLGNNQVNQSEFIITTVGDLVIKGEKLLNAVHTSKEKNLPDNIVNVLEKNCIILTHDLSDLLLVSPLVFTGFLRKFMEFTVTIFKVQWERENLQKSVSLLLYRILKTYIFFVEPSDLEGKKLYTKLKVNQDLQKQCHIQFREFFNNEERIREIMSYIISNLMIYNNPSEDFEVFIEDQEGTGLDTVLSELDCSLPKIGAATVEKLFNRFPEPALKVFFQSLEEILNGKTEIPDLLQDSVFNLVGYLPKVYSFLGKEPKDIAINGVIDYLASRSSSNIIFARRFLIVLNSFIAISDFGNKKELSETVLKFVDIEDEIVQFEAVNCLANLIKLDHDLDLDYPKLIRMTTPIFVKMLKIIKSQGLVIKLNIFLLNLLEKTQYAVDEDVLLALKDLDLATIVAKNPKLLKPMLSDILTSLVIAFADRQSDMIIDLALSFLRVCLNDFDKEDSGMVLKFMSLTLRNIPCEEKNRQKIEFLKNNFFDFFDQFYKEKDVEIYVNMLNLVEEFILLGFVSSELDYRKMFSVFYQDSRQFDPNDANLIKCHVFTTFTTLFLVVKETGSFALSDFEVGL